MKTLMNWAAEQWLVALLSGAMILMPQLARADLLYTVAGSVYMQDFNSLASSGTNIPWANDSTIESWHLFRSNGSAITSYDAGSGSGNAGSFYSYGSTNSSDRALGGLGSGGIYFGSPANGAIAGYIAFSVQNGTGTTLTSVTIGFDGEQWRNGGNTTPQDMVLEYGFGTTFGTVGSWTAPGGNFNWTSPIATGTSGAVDGNVAGLVSARGGTLNNLNWTNGSRMWIRWIERNDDGNDHGLAIDNFTFSAVPEPSSLSLVGLTACMALIRRRRS